MISRISLAISFSAALATSCLADVRPIKLETLIGLSDSIVVGKVVSVRAVNDELRVAEVEIGQTLKGASSVKRLYYQIPRYSLEDTSDAQVGETALLFLRQPHNLQPSNYPKAIQEITNGTPLFYLSHAGRGRLIPTSLNGISYVYVRRDGSIIVPESVAIEWGSDPSDPGLGLVKLDDLINFIAGRLRTNKSAVGSVKTSAEPRSDQPCEPDLFKQGLSGIHEHSSK